MLGFGFGLAETCAREFPPGPFVFALFIATVALTIMTGVMVSELSKQNYKPNPRAEGLTACAGVALIMMAWGLIAAVRGV
jgi:hypothetical protein